MSFYLLLLTLLCFFVCNVYGNPALEIYPSDGNGGMVGHKQAPFFCLSKVETPIFDALTGYPCTEEPYFMCTITYNSHNSMVPRYILPYSSFWETRNSDFFRIYLTQDPSVQAKYIGPVATHIFPPPKEQLDEFLIVLPPKIPRAEGGFDFTTFSFEVDIAKNYEFPVSGLYSVLSDAPLYAFYNETDFYVHRYRGSSAFSKMFRAEECINSRITVNEISTETTFRFCDEDQISKYNRALEYLNEIADEVLVFLGGKASFPQKYLLQNYFGKWGNDASVKDKLRSIFKKVKSLVPSVIECNEGRSYFTQGTTIPREEVAFYEEKFENLYETDARPTTFEETSNSEPREIIDNPSGTQKLEYQCTIGVTSWLIPRDLSSTVHLCPSFFKYGEKERAFFLLDSLVRFDSVAGAIDYLLGDENALTLAKTQFADVCLRNAGSLVGFAKAVSKA